ncbi:MAG: DUF3854 domain-containing protein [Leptolyngbya sp. DLM2.Bin15]|nr:MAG: DUF3854 domain-containing protein [Leptolyngbya sp. DLM2.Bin15]
MNQSNPFLHARHRDEWLASGVDEAIIMSNVWTIEDPQQLDKLLNRNTKSRWKHSDDLVPGWAVAGCDPVTGEATLKGAQFKPDKPKLDPHTRKPRKYLSPSRQTLAPLFLTPGTKLGGLSFWANVKEDKSQPLLITEGAKKAGCVLSRGIPCVSIPGVSTGGKLGRLRPELEHFADYGRLVYLAFDRDIITKPQVRNALHNLGRMLKAKGCMVYVMEWRNDKKGIDDYLAVGYELQPIIDNAKTLEEWHDAWDDEPDSEDLEQCKLALRYKLIAEKIGDRLKFNDLKGVIELDGQTADTDELRLYLALKFNIEVPQRDCETIIPVLAKRGSYSPVAAYLKQCADNYDPDPDLLDAVAKLYLGAESALHACYIRKTLISAVARALNPGCKVDTVCILSGLQGVGKSTFWKLLAGEEWFDDTVGSVSDKDERLKLHQSWFVEWAELEAVFRRKDVSAVKAFITTQRDQIRPPYGRVVKEFARPSIIVGTTNFDEFLADPTGNRRFWVVPVNKAVPLDELATERDRIWAAAVHAYHAGEGWTLPAGMRDEAVKENENYQLSDPWEEPIFSYCEGLERVNAADVLTFALKIDVDRHDRASQMRVTNLLKAGGWTSVREVVHGRRLRFWYPPKVLDIGCPGCPEEAEKQAVLEGQPSGQPPGQPTGQPPENHQNPPPPPPPNEPRDNLDNLDNLIPKTRTRSEKTLSSSSEPSIKVGDWVEIRHGGMFFGKEAIVESIGAFQVVVRHPSWVVPHCYKPENLKKVKAQR